MTRDEAIEFVNGRLMIARENAARFRTGYFKDRAESLVAEFAGLLELLNADTPEPTITNDGQDVTLLVMDAKSALEAIRFVCKNTGSRQPGIESIDEFAAYAIEALK